MKDIQIPQNLKLEFQEYTKNVRLISPENTHGRGGQQVAYVSPHIIVYNIETGLALYVNEYRSQLKNRDNGTKKLFLLEKKLENFDKVNINNNAVIGTQINITEPVNNAMFI